MGTLKRASGRGEAGRGTSGRQRRGEGGRSHTHYTLWGGSARKRGGEGEALKVLQSRADCNARRASQRHAKPSHARLRYATPRRVLLRRVISFSRPAIHAAAALMLMIPGAGKSTTMRMKTVKSRIFSEEGGMGLWHGVPAEA